MQPRQRSALTIRNWQNPTTGCPEAEEVQMGCNTESCDNAFSSSVLSQPSISYCTGLCPLHCIAPRPLCCIYLILCTVRHCPLYRSCIVLCHLDCIFATLLELQCHNLSNTLSSALYIVLHSLSSSSFHAAVYPLYGTVICSALAWPSIAWLHDGITDPGSQFPLLPNLWVRLSDYD